MAVKSVECQLAEMQIGRYVAGDNLSSEAVLQLERHVARCESCREVLGSRKSALRAMLGHGFAAVSTDRTGDKENQLLSVLREKTRPSASAAKDAEPEARPAVSKSAKPTLREQIVGRLSSGQGGSTKALIYCAALAGVLFGMGYVSRSQSSLLGGSADQAFAAPTTSTAPQPPMTKKASKSPHPAPAKVSTPPAPTPQAAPSPEADLSAKVADHPPTPIHKQAKRRFNTAVPRHYRVHSEQPAQSRRPKAAVKIRVYDESGNPLGNKS